MGHDKQYYQIKYLWRLIDYVMIAANWKNKGSMIMLNLTDLLQWLLIHNNYLLELILMHSWVATAISNAQ